MTTEEFSNEFDSILQNYSIKDQFGQQNPIAFDEYEKSIFLTKAQEELVISYYAGSQINNSFEQTEEVRRYLDALVKKNVQESTQGTKEDGFNHSIWQLPSDTWYIIWEEARVSQNEITCMKGKRIAVIPTTHDEYHRTINNPFRGPSKRRVLRLDVGEKTVELISRFPLQEYSIKYISEPKPIILTDLPEDLNINGIRVKTECNLNTALHRPILNRAVQLALASKAIGANDN